MQKQTVHASSVRTIEIELPPNPGGQYSDEAMRIGITKLARALEDHENNQRTLHYGTTDPATGACGNWIANYDGNGVCDYLPLPPNRYEMRAVRTPVGWNVSDTESAEALTDICQLKPDWLADLSNSCRQKLGIAKPAPPPAGKFVLGPCWSWYGNRCQAGLGDTVEHGAEVDGSNFPDGITRYKVVRAGFGRQVWYQPGKP